MIDMILRNILYNIDFTDLDLFLIALRERKPGIIKKKSHGEHNFLK